MLEIFRVAAQVVASQEGLSSVESVSLPKMTHMLYRWAQPDVAQLTLNRTQDTHFLKFFYRPVF
jgi:hypothetical protein